MPDFASRALCVCSIAMLLLAAVAPTPIRADSVATRERTVTKLADGVYEIRHPDAPDGFPQGNTTVVIGEKGVLVVDSCYLPSTAREDIAQIRKWTDRPVRYLVNTHWHPDHQRGNAAYAEAFPNVVIVSQTQTSTLMESFDGPNLTRYPVRCATLEKKIVSGVGDDGKPLSAAEKAALETTLSGWRSVLAEIQGTKPHTADLTFDNNLTLDLGNREVRIMHVGFGHTVGDAVVYLPKERILITGDVLVSPVPYFFGGDYPYDSIVVLEKLRALDTVAIVPGHGEVLYDKVYLDRVIAFLKDVSARVWAEVYRRGSLSAKLEDVRGAIDLTAYRKQFAGDDPENGAFFDESMADLIMGLFNQVQK